MARGKKAAQGLTPEEKLTQALVPMEEQPYRIPENWCWVRWGCAGEFIAGSGFKNQYQGHTEFEIPFYKVGSLKYSDNAGYLYDNSNTVNEEIRKELKAPLIPTNSIIFAKIGEAIRLNRRSVNMIPCCIDNNLMSFVPTVCKYRYVFYWSQGLDLYKYTNATTVPAIRKSDLENISFPVAPLLEQQRIVNRIESVFAKLDEAKEKAQAVVDGFELRKSAILHKAFTGELTAKWREEHGVTLDRWAKSTFSDVVDEFKYGLSEKSDYGYDGIPVFRIPNVTDNGLSFDDLKYLSHSQIDSSSLLRKDDVLIIRSNGSKELVGKSVLVPSLDKEYTYASFLIRARLNPKIVPAYFVYYINSSDARIQMFKKAKSSAGINNINSKELGAINILVCSVSEQSEIIRILDGLLAKENAAKEAAESVLDQIETMKKAVLARAFRGELGTNDPTEESAVELLKSGL